MKKEPASNHTRKFSLHGVDYDTVESITISALDRRPERSHRNAVGASAAVLEQLSVALGKVTDSSHPRTFKLLQSGRRKSARKLVEEACEIAVEVARRNAEGVVSESADLLYHLVVLWFRAGVMPIDVWREMQARADALGIAEKRPKPSAPNGVCADCNP